MAPALSKVVRKGVLVKEVESKRGKNKNFVVGRKKFAPKAIFLYECFNVDEGSKETWNGH